MQVYTCIMIPKFDQNGNLPPGQHLASWQEVFQRYGYNFHRKRLLRGLKAALANLKKAGCQRIYLDGSFICDKETPGDFDLCWEPKGVDYKLLDPLFYLTVNVMPPRKKQKDKYLGEVILTLSCPAVFDHLSYFQFDDRSGHTKGIIAIDLLEEPP